MTEVNVEICDKCGAVLEIGDHPFCPHGQGFAASHGDELDYIDHNLGPEPVHIRSKAERRRIMKERGLEEFIRHMPVPGTDRSPFTTDWSKGSMDPQTLHNAEELVRRVYGQTPPPPKPADEVYDPVANPFNFTASTEDMTKVTELVDGK